MTNSKIAVAVALALGSVTAAHAAVPSIATCQGAPAARLYVAGSSAAQPAFSNALAVGLFGGATNMLVFATTNGNFQAFCGTAANASAGVSPGSLVIVHYRGEGGSVTGALPIAAIKAVKFLDLPNVPTTSVITVNAAGVSTAAVVTGGTASTVGTTDGFTGPLTTHLVELGVTDVEPAQFKGTNYPADYNTGVFGSATPTQLANLTKAPLFDQVFGIAVNTSGLNVPLDLSKQAIANILTGQYVTWDAVPAGGGGAAGTGSIRIVNREEGSGTRTGASVYFLGTGCGATATTGNFIHESSPAVPNQFSTGDALANANSNPGSITYASIDQLPSSKYPNLVFVSINGIVPSNLAAATGQYDFWNEAQMITGTAPPAGSSALLTYIRNTLPTINGAPNVKHILAIPDVPASNPNTAQVPVQNTANGSPAIYINPFTKGGNTCSVPQSTNF